MKVLISAMMLLLPSFWDPSLLDQLVVRVGGSRMMPPGIGERFAVIRLGR